MSLFRPTVLAVAHENAVIEAGLRHILGAWPEFELRPPPGANQAAATQASDPDMVVLDHDSGIRWATDHQRHRASADNVLVVATAGQEMDVRSALAAGVRGYVFIGCSADEIVRAARAVAGGRRHLCSAATRRMAESLVQPALTLRESEVLALVFRGLNNKDLARSLGISLGTVKCHMRGLLGKLGARCRTEALWIASQRGLIVRTEEVDSDLLLASRRPVRLSRPIPNPSHLQMARRSAA